MIEKNLSLENSVMAQTTVLGILLKDQKFKKALDKAKIKGNKAKERALLKKRLKDAEKEGVLSKEAVQTMWQLMFKEEPEVHPPWKFWK